jgi:hypothetical protein
MTNNNQYHPSFLPLLDRIRERGMLSPWAFVEWEPWEHGHKHIVILGDGEGGYSSIQDGGSIEEPAEELVEAISTCNPDRHEGHGLFHDPGQHEMAYRAAIEQLQTREFDREHAHQLWLQAMHKKWGGHIPAAVVMPIEDSWKLMVPNSAGDPLLYDVQDHLINSIPMPNTNIAVPAPLGWSRKQKWSPERRLRFLAKKGR